MTTAYLWTLLAFADGPNAVAPRPGVAEPLSIINGETATKEEFPMAGALLMRSVGKREDGGVVDLGTSFNCSSALIAPDVVLTAAHCVDIDTFNAAGIHDIQLFWSRQADLFDYAIGPEIDMPVPDPPAEAIAVADVMMHPRFDNEAANVPLGQVFDIGLVFLAEATVDTPIGYIPEDGDDSVVRPDERVTVVGWGKSMPEAPEEYSRFIGLKRFGVSPIGEVGPWEFQVGTEPSNPRQCHGDSGGPVLALPGAAQVGVQVIGVASRTPDLTLCESLGVINTRVAPYRAWIEAEMLAACEDGRRSACQEPELPRFGDGEDTGGDETDGGGCSVAGTAPRPNHRALLALALLGVFGRRSRLRRIR